MRAALPLYHLSPTARISTADRLDLIQPDPRQALCTEAALAALRRRYPQIYDSDDKLVVEPDAVVVEREDFLTAHGGGLVVGWWVGSFGG
jgi:hypothetical protein